MKPSPHEGSSTIEFLQAGRAIAALAVVLCHSGTYVGHRYGSEHYNLGVDFFFCLSGYIIYHVTAGRDFRLGVYALKRARRIFLPYWPAGLAMAVLYLAMGKDFSILASAALTPGKPALLPAWSLQHELAFYVLAAAGFMLGRPLLLIAGWGVAMIAAWVGSVPIGGLGDGAYILLSPRNLAFVIGVFAGAIVRVPRVRVGRTLNLLGDASYSIYLTHLPVMGVAWRLGADFWTLALAGVAAGLAYHRLVEKPLLCLGLSGAGRFPAALAFSASVAPAERRCDQTK